MIALKASLSEEETQAATALQPDKIYRRGERGLAIPGSHKKAVEDEDSVKES